MIREPAVAGMFYPEDAAELRTLVEEYLAAPDAEQGHGIVVPHAGYVYSGAMAGLAFKALRSSSVVIMLGPSHHAAFRGVAMDSSLAWRTPLGETRLERAPLGPPFQSLPEAHAPEHALEVQLPFLQVVAPEARILPLLVGHVSLEDASMIAARLRKEYPGASWIVSTDLSHYHPAEEAARLDEETLRVVTELDVAAADRMDACGRYPLLVLMAACRREGWRPELLARTTSAEASGDASAVVGYAALRF